MARARTPSEPAAQAYPHPREQMQLFGHAAAERIFLDACRAGRLHHAWLVGGPAGIGKATLAYRMARFILAHPDFSSEEVTAAKNLAVSPMNTAAHQVTLGSHPDCHSIEPDDEKAKKIIPIAPVRELIHKMQNTSGNGGWRVAIIDSVDALNASAANALLKMLEEPPPRCLFLLIAHQPGRVMATLRSRCQKLLLNELTDADLEKVVLSVAPEIELEQLAGVLPFANGSVLSALQLLNSHALADRAALSMLLDKLPRLDAKALQQFCDSIARKGEESFSAITAHIIEWCHAQASVHSTSLLAGLLAGYSEGFQYQARVTMVYNLDRKSFLVTQLGRLSRLYAQKAA